MIREAIDAVVSGRSLSMEDAATVMREIMEGEATSGQLGPFLTALRQGMPDETQDRQGR